MKPKKYRFVHSNGTVELFTDTTGAPTENKSQNKSTKYGHKQTSDSENFLTPSETEPDDSEFMSENPVSLRQVRGLKENEKLRRCQFGDDGNENLPVYYSTNRRQRRSTVGRQHGKSETKHVTQSKDSSFNHRHRRRNGSSDDSSDSDSDKSSDDGRYNDELPEFNRNTIGGRRRNSFKENESSDEEHFKRENFEDQNRKPRRSRRHRHLSSSGDRSKGSRKGYMKPDKYEGLTCFETFLTQFNNCAEYNRWSDSEKLSHLRWSLKGSSTQMLCGARDMTYKQLVTRLRSRFGSADMEEHYRADLQCRRRKNNETLKELAQDIRRLMMLSYPGDQTPISENLAKEHFIVALEDPELELKIRQREPRTLDSALRLLKDLKYFGML